MQARRSLPAMEQARSRVKQRVEKNTGERRERDRDGAVGKPIDGLSCPGGDKVQDKTRSTRAEFISIAPYVSPGFSSALTTLSNEDILQQLLLRTSCEPADCQKSTVRHADGDDWLGR